MNTLDWINATPEQKNFWKLASAKLAYATITPMFYQGVIAGTEFLTYDAAKLYIALELEFGAAASAASQSSIGLYDETNTLSFNPANDYTYAVNIFIGNSFAGKNYYFSRFITVNIANMKFNGYKLHT
jgi:hypothetical protein